MCIKIKKGFFKALTFENLYTAHNRAKKGKALRKEVILFEKDLENNLINLLNKLRNGTYKVGTYRSFLVYEPKEREIKALPYIDRIVHQWYIEEFIKPYIVPRLIHTTYACIKDRGTHKSVAKVQHNMQLFKRNISEDYYILKCDIKKFFMSIEPNILFDIMKKYISDKKLLALSRTLIFDNFDSNIGIPIGNYSSQFFANIYLNELDQYVKHELKNKSYVRYMDDFILLLKTKEEAIELKDKIEKFINTKLKLELNHKSRYYPSKMGLNFCGYIIYPTHKLLRQSSKKKINRNVRKWNSLYKQKKLCINTTISSLNSWLGHIKHCDSYNIQTKILNKCDFLYNAKFNESLENNILDLIENYDIRL